MAWCEHQRTWSMPFHQPLDDYHPTRLLDVVPSDGPATVLLIESRDFVNAGPYSALSHFWGRTSPIKLTKNNIHALRKGWDLSELPKTFQHAILIARFVSIRYLWIDSLCIIQDSYQDWERESCLMKDVYKNTLLKIASTGSVDSFFKRDVDAVSTIHISMLVPESSWYIHYLRQRYLGWQYFRIAIESTSLGCSRTSAVASYTASWARSNRVGMSGDRSMRDVPQYATLNTDRIFFTLKVSHIKLWPGNCPQILGFDCRSIFIRSFD